MEQLVLRSWTVPQSFCQSSQIQCCTHTTRDSRSFWVTCIRNINWLPCWWSCTYNTSDITWTLVEWQHRVLLRCLLRVLCLGSYQYVDTKENNKVVNRDAKAPWLAQWNPSQIWVWKVSDSIEQNRMTDLTSIMQCHEADFRVVVPRCALVLPAFTNGITVFTTCTMMITLPSFRIVPRAAMHNTNTVVKNRAKVSQGLIMPHKISSRNLWK